VRHSSKPATHAAAAAFAGLALAMLTAPAGAQSWLDKSILDAAKKEGSLVVYGSMNEQEALPYYKIFEDATGIKVSYIRSSDTGIIGRIQVEFRANKPTWDVVMTTPVNRLPDSVLAAIEPPEAKGLIPQARGPNKRWYGTYANYNTPAYNTCRKTMRNSSSARSGVARSPSTRATANG
jgi:hypothetical protein